MTNKTVTLGIRLNRADKEELAKYITRESLISILGQIKRGEIAISSEGVEISSVNTISESVNTNPCEGCPYEDAPDLSGFNEVCEFKGIDKQKAIDKCVQMLWR